MRRNGLNKPILVLGVTFPEQYESLLEKEIRPTVYSLKQAQELEEFAGKAGKSIQVHIKIDTGLSRLGFQVTEEAAEEIAQIARMPHMIVEGVFTHFAKSDARDKTMAMDQMEKFQAMKQMLADKKVVIPVSHCSNSAAIIDMPQANMSLVRAGISLYGMWPSGEVQKEASGFATGAFFKKLYYFFKRAGKKGEPLATELLTRRKQSRRLQPFRWGMEMAIPEAFPTGDMC